MRWIWYVVAALWALDALRMRVRVKSIPTLAPPDAEQTIGGYSTVDAAVEVDAGTRAAAIAYARREGIGLLDLIPADTPALLAMGIVQLIDPAAYRNNPIAKGHSTGSALLAEDDLFARAGVTPDQRTDVEGLVQSAQQLKRVAIDRAALVVAPLLHSRSDHGLANWRVFAAIVGRPSRFVLAIQGLMLALLAAGLYVAPMAALVALVVFHLQPLVVFAGLPIRPGDLERTVLLRFPIEIWNWIRLVLSLVATPAPIIDDTGALARRYADQMKDGVGRFFEARRDTCPLCDGSSLRPFIRTRDLIQHKPGTFVLEKCLACGHIFQNPRLSAAGLEFYYGDFYDGIGTAVTEALLGAPLGLYLARARVIEGLATPARWLDVGTAQGHFCCAAREAWPQTRFDGLDIGQGVEQAERAGWVEHGYRGFLPDVADDLAGTYDVVSLFHCLEHTPDPRAELAAAYRVLAPGGLLVIEVPNPECVMGHIFGRFWFPWFQPQHLHLLSVANLSRLLRDAGFEPAVVQLGRAHLRVEFASTIMVFLSWFGPKLHVPWRRGPRALDYARRAIGSSIAVLVVPLAMCFDALCTPLFRRLDVSNAYRMVARRDRVPLVRPAVEIEASERVWVPASV
jgi:SAM-dependent methyltransferase